MTIEDLISKGEDIRNSITGTRLNQHNEFKVWVETVLRYLNKTLPGDMSIGRFEKQVCRFNPGYCYKDEFDDILCVLRGVEAIPDKTVNTAIPDDNKGNAISINNNLSQTQDQNQNLQLDVVINILLEAIKDELTGRQRKEILDIAKNCKTPEEAQKSIFEKIKEYGEGVSASIVANILTNPSVWSTLESLI